MTSEPLPEFITTSPGLYRHYKGNLYEVIDTVRHSETMEPLTLYRALYGERGLWVRPAAMFNETVVIDGVEQPRFAKVDASEPLLMSSRQAVEPGQQRRHDGAD
jgi:hypothetical protein